MKLTVIGLGKLGLPLACLQAQHHRVFGIDLNQDTVNAINRGRSPIDEPGVEDLIDEVVLVTGQLTAHSNYGPVTGTDMSMVIVPTPSGGLGAFSSQYVIEALREIGTAIAGQVNRHVVVICSTVMPGECDGFRSVLEKYSGKEVGGRDLGLVYSPEFIALGTVIEDMKWPAVTLIGESDEESGRAYLQVARSITNEGPGLPPYRRMSLTSAEIAKISLNAYVTMKISFANVLGEVCERYAEADAFEIAQAIGLDPRVGKQYLRPGGPYGGPCFPRDNRAFALVGENVGVSMPLAKATDEINDRQIDRMVRHLASYSQRTVGILGLSYKPGTSITEESFGIKLAKALEAEGYEVRVFDKGVQRKVGVLPLDVMWHTDLGMCVGNDVITVIANPDPAIVGHFPTVLSGEARQGAVIIDPWDCIPKGPWDETHVIRLGRCSNAA